MEYSERIKQYRTQKNVTQQQLADEIGVSRQSVVRWENGWSVPSMYYAQRLADYFGITVNGLMTGFDEAPKVEKLDRDMRVRCGTSVVKFCLVVFLIVVTYSLLCDLMSTIRYYLMHGGVNYAVLSSTFSMLYSIADSLAVAALAVALALWIARLVAWLGATDDKYTWYRIYKKWTVGLAVWLINVLTVALIVYVNIMSVVFLYVVAAVIAVPIYCLIDFAIKKALGERMIVAHNRTLDIVNRVYCAVVSCGVVALLAWIIYAVTTFRPTYGLAVAFAILYFSISAIVLIISYVVVRVTLHSVSVRRDKENDLQK